MYHIHDQHTDAFIEAHTTLLDALNRCAFAHTAGRLWLVRFTDLSGQQLDLLS
jgi:hypothetical protein